MQSNESDETVNPDTRAMHVDTGESDSDTLSVHELEIYDDWDDSENNPKHVNLCFSDPYSFITVEEKPIMYEEAISPENIAKWDFPIKSELNAMSKHNVFGIIKREKGMNIILTC